MNFLLFSQYFTNNLLNTLNHDKLTQSLSMNNWNFYVVLDLSNNNITKLNPNINWPTISSLQILYLHNNKFNTIQSLENLLSCSSLIYLTVSNNNFVNINKINHILITSLQNLKALDNHIVLLEERSETIFEHTNIHAIKIDIDMLCSWISTQNTQQYYLRVLKIQLQYLDIIWLNSNPIVKIQREWKKKVNKFKTISFSKYNNQYNMKLSSQNSLEITEELKFQQINQLKQLFYQWRSYTYNLQAVKDLLEIKIDSSQSKQYLTLPLKQYLKAIRNQKVQQVLKKYMKYIRQKVYTRKMVNRFRKNIILKKFAFNSSESFYQIAGISQNHRVYYSVQQRHLLNNFLYQIAENFNKREQIYDKSIHRISTEYRSIRLTDPITYLNKSTNNILGYLIWPNMKLIITPRKKKPCKIQSNIIKLKPLTYIKNRNKFITKQQYEKSVKTYKKINKFMTNEYQQTLYYFQCKDKFVMQHLLRCLYYHNHKALQFDVKIQKGKLSSLIQDYSENFMLYVDRLMQRTAAAVSIQQCWRKYISNKRLPESLFSKLKRTRAAMRIQRFIRDRIFFHRLAFNTTLSVVLRQLNTTQFMLPEIVYFYLRHLTNQQLKLPLYPNLFLYRDDDDNIEVVSSSQKAIFNPKIRKRYFKGKNYTSQQFRIQADIYDLMHLNAQVRIIQYKGNTMYHFTYESQSQLNLRVSIIALLSYNFFGRISIYPIFKQHFGMLSERFKVYNSYKCIRNMIQIKNSDENKIIIKRQIKLDALFMALKNEEEEVQNMKNTRQISVEFYKKVQNNFPQKRITKLKFWLLQKQIKKQQKKNHFQEQKQNEKLSFGDKKSILFQNAKNFGKTDIKLMKPPKTNNNNLKRNSMYSFGFNQQILEKKSKKNQIVEQNKTIKQQFRVLQIQAKKNFVISQNKKQQEKRQTIKENKKYQLHLMRQNVRKQKVMNSAIRSLKQQQKTEDLRQRVTKVREMKNRLSETKRQDDDFFQQSNFVMEQQLKMIILRNRKKDQQRKKQIKGHNVKDNSSQIQAQNSNSEMSRSHHQKRRKSNTHKYFFKDTEPINKQATKQQEENKGQQKTNVIMNLRNTQMMRKTRTHSIGAYIRDPSYVHGVFPQEYYPIQNRGNFIFPPI